MFENGILNIPGIKGLAESTSEFVQGGNSTNDVSNHIEDPNVTIPGGLKEQPTKDAITMTTKEYEDLIHKYQLSFKECAEIINDIGRIRIVDESADNEHESQLELAMESAIFELYDSGPMFEAVNRSDKKDVKKIVSSLRPKIEEYCKEGKINYRKPNKILRIIIAALPAASWIPSAIAMAGAPAAIPAVAMTTAAAVSEFWSERLWQIAGLVNLESGNVGDLQKTLNEKFADELGEYKILFSKTTGNLIDLFCNKFGWKNKKRTYFVLIDKKLPDELKQLEDAVKSGMDAKKNNVVKEGTDMNELYKQYLTGYAESGITEPPFSYTEFEERVNEMIADNEERDLQESYQDYLLQFAECGFSEAPCSFAEFTEAVTGRQENDEEITEATRLAKEIHKKKDDYEAATKILNKLTDMQRRYERNTTEYKLIQKKIDKIKNDKNNSGYLTVKGHEIDANEVDSLGRGKNGKTANSSILRARTDTKTLQKDLFNTRPAKPRKPLSELKKELDAIGESFNPMDLLAMYTTDDNE